MERSVRVSSQASTCINSSRSNSGASAGLTAQDSLLDAAAATTANSRDMPAFRRRSDSPIGASRCSNVTAARGSGSQRSSERSTANLKRSLQCSPMRAHSRCGQLARK
eukprot:1397-Heterococcus_DN1.PRE.1